MNVMYGFDIIWQNPLQQFIERNEIIKRQLCDNNTDLLID